MDKFQIGWYTVSEDTEYTDRGYECAAWFKRIMVKAGKYPVMADKFFYNEREKTKTNQLEDRAISIKLTGTVTADDFAGRFCGNLIEGAEFNKYVGQDDSLYLTPYTHSVAHSILGGKSNIELLDEFEAREIHFVSCIFGKEEPCVTYGIFQN